jgi:hypothetical protein
MFFYAYSQEDSIEYVKCDSLTIVGITHPEALPVYRLGKCVGKIFSLRPFLSDSIDCPLENCDSISGRVFIQFFVQKNMEISNIKIIKGVNRDIDKVAVRIVNRLECITPAMIGKKPIQYKEVIPVIIEFKK